MSGAPKQGYTSESRGLPGPCTKASDYLDLSSRVTFRGEAGWKCQGFYGLSVSLPLTCSTIIFKGTKNGQHETRRDNNQPQWETT